MVARRAEVELEASWTATTGPTASKELCEGVSSGEAAAWEALERVATLAGHRVVRVVAVVVPLPELCGMGA